MVDSLHANITKTTPSTLNRRTTIVKSANTTPKTASPFLINKSTFAQQIGRKSFLNRDERTLEKLANLSKVTGDTETVASTAKAKGNYVFTVTEKVEPVNVSPTTLVSFYICQWPHDSPLGSEETLWESHRQWHGGEERAEKIQIGEVFERHFQATAKTNVWTAQLNLVYLAALTVFWRLIVIFWRSK